MTKRLALLGFMLLGLSHGSLGHAQSVPTPPLATVKPDKGFIDDAMAITPGGAVLLYVTTDGQKFASLRGLALPAGKGLNPQAAIEPPAAAPPPPAPPAAPVGKGAKGKPPAPVAAPPVPPPPVPFMEEALAKELSAEPQKTKELLKKLPLNTNRLLLLPDDKILLVMRDLETAGQVTGQIYSLKTHAEVPVAGGIGPATDISLTTVDGQPAIVAVSKPGPQSPQNPRSLLSSEYKFTAYSAATGKQLSQRTYKLDEEGQIQTGAGSALPLYFLDGYATWVLKQSGAFDKKKDVRQPDVVAFFDVFGGKVRSTRPIIDAPALMDLKRVRAAQSESVVIFAEDGTNQVEIVSALERGRPEGPVEYRGQLPLPRPAGIYDAPSLRFVRLRSSKLLLSLMVDPVNEEAVAQKRTDPDEVDFCMVDLSGDKPGSAERKLTLLAGKRPLGWVASPSGRVVVLRKHKGFSRGGTEAEVYDLAP
jgi:hypothetical protein